ncbi:hypothetical protein FHS18_000582 [Paenibacillus phyllosphaerae]|uniref:Coenzyme PQQ synthesis protein D (PqqD) n=1 Tax=Paenibacillus phyllosphaerae TaxID=274593 RepID=A0A7W5FL11_9BACL|nr:lasso peptide biosynthesis PqqD family chaperone [Paenibacillus phyllosphaerae]MBB3108554.1 hypothetical protein [Paenibacillus phyllosphaerae]
MSTVAEQFVQSKGSLASNMDGEKVMMRVETGKYYNLGAIGGRIWDLLEQPQTVNQLVEALTQEYEIGMDECTAQVESFLKQLQSEQLVEAV